MSDFFKYLTGFHRQKGYQKLLVAPHSMHRQLIRLCDIEIENARKGRPAGITIKCNALDDQVSAGETIAADDLHFENLWNGFLPGRVAGCRGCSWGCRWRADGSFSMHFGAMY